ncbi:MAG TPA: K+/H+ antiporter subunit F [Burkholderiales bacterium]|nr:K+/H+ antiporter subunit F [Burkholderiales bacterium]
MSGLPEAVLNASLLAAQVLVALAMVFATWRLLRGPRAQDRVLALDTVYVDALILFVLVGIREGTEVYFEAALVIAMVGFVATVALAKFLLRGEVIER